MSKPIVGAQLYTVRDFMKTPEEMAVSLRKIRDIGFTTVQVSGIGPIDWKRDLAALLRENGLECVATHVPLDRMLHDTDALVAEHQAIGCPVMGVGAMPPAYRNEEGCRAFAGVLNEIGRRIAGAGLKVSYHNHNFEFFRTADGKKNGLDLLIENTDPQTVEFILDTYWIVAGGGSPIDYIQKTAGRNSVIHYKDMKMKSAEQAEPVMTECGTGNILFGPIDQACEAAGIRHAVIEQDICTLDPFESLAISFRNLTAR